MSRASVLGCGLATLDIVQYLDAIPKSNQKVVARELLVSAGGPALNATLVARALGADAVLVTAVGGGSIADLICSEVNAAGVELIDLAPTDASPPVSTVLVETTGERAVVSVNATGMEALRAEAPTLPAGVTAVLVDGHRMSLCVSIASAAQKAAIPVVFDGGSWKQGTEKLLASVDCAVISADFTLDGASPELAAVAQLGPRFVARTNGAAGVEYLDAATGASGTLPVPTVRVVDTLGAGDNFHGGVLAFVAAHALSSDTFPRALAFAIEVAAVSCQHPGARGWIAAGAGSDLAAQLG